jgi:molybdopterin-synthase adenylyltransferase
MQLPSSFFPLLPAYLKVTSVRLLQEEPARFELRLAVHPATPQEQRAIVGAETLYVLALADGARTLEECLDRVRLELGSERDCATELGELVACGILVDGQARPELRPNVRDRFSRHRLFYASVGASTSVQERLSAAQVALIGVGGVGTWLSFLLGAAGVGALKLIDGDEIEESNLTRQMYFTMGDIGSLKVDVARQRLLQVNPGVECRALGRPILTDEDMSDLVGDVDLIILSGDQPSDINDIVDRYSVRKSIPWSSAGYAHSLAICGPLLVPGTTGCRSCMVSDDAYAPVGDLPFLGEINARFQVPSFGPVNGLAASAQAKEAIAWLGGMKNIVTTIDAVFALDALTMQSAVTPVSHRRDCSRCGGA